MLFQKTLLLLIVARVSSYTASYSAPAREWATQTAYQPDFTGHYGGKYPPGPWTGSFSRTLDTADGFQQGKSSRWTGSSPTAAYSPYWNGARSEYGSSYSNNNNNNNNAYYPTGEYSYENMYAAQGQGYPRSNNNNNGYRFYDDNNYSARYATPYSQSNRQGNYAYGVSSQYSGANYRSNGYATQAYAGRNYNSRRTENSKKVDRWTGSSPSNSNSRYLYDYAGRYYSMDGAFDDAYGAEMAYGQQQGPYSNGYARRGEDYRYNDRSYQASSRDGRGPYNQWTAPTSSNNYSSRNYERNQAYGDRNNQGYYGGFDSRDAYYDGGRYGFDRSAYRANEQMNSFQSSVYGSGRQGQSWKSPLSPDDLASRKSTDDWSSASR